MIHPFISQREVRYNTALRNGKNALKFNMNHSKALVCRLVSLFFVCFFIKVFKVFDRKGSLGGHFDWVQHHFESVVIRKLFTI